MEDITMSKYHSQQKGSIKAKLSILLTSTIMMVVFVLGLYFDGFLKKSSLENARVRMLHGYERLQYNINQIERELQDGVALVVADERFLASVELINNYQDKNNYVSSLLDEEKQQISRYLLSRVKLSFNDDILLYDINHDVMSFVTKEDKGYHLNYISYKDNKVGLYSRNEHQRDYSSRNVEHPLNFSFNHKNYYDPSTIVNGSKVTYRHHNNKIVITAHRNVLDGELGNVVAHIEMSRILDQNYFEQLSQTLDLGIRYSFDSALYTRSGMIQQSINPQQLRIIQTDFDYATILGQDSQDGPIYYIATLNKGSLNALLNENRVQFLLIMILVVIIIILLMRYVIHRWLDRPLSELMVQIDKIESQDYSASEPVKTGDELESISVNINQLALTIQERELSLGISRDELEHLSNHDELTNLPNRRVFSLCLQHGLELASRSHGRMAIIFIDMDNFKMVNDTLGHDVGDQLLIQVSRRLKKYVRSADTLARIGGDEFNILIENAADNTNLEKIVKKYMSLFNEPFNCGDHTISVTVSVGISIYPEDGEDCVTLIKHADLAMYSSKDQGRNSYTFFSNELSVRAEERVRLIQDLDKAIVSGNQFHLHYQAKVSAGTHKVNSIEALIRWEHPEQGLVVPDKFIPLSEDTGQIVAIGRWVIQQACEDFVHLQEEGIQLRHVSINISNVQLSKDDILSFVQDTITRTGILPGQIELEITESYIATDVEHAITSLQKFSEMGVGIAVDDFGTGYSSMSYLHKLPISRLKIDKSFVNDLPASKDSSTITRAIISLAKSFDLEITAEGVENKEQLLFLESEKCDEIQGYYFSKPLPINDFKKFYLSKSIERINTIND